MTSHLLPLTTALTTWPAGPGAAPAARRATRAWAADPLLAAYPSPGAVALEMRSADPSKAAILVEALASRAEPEATVAVLAGLAPRLARITHRWAAAGIDRADLADLEADLVAGCVEILRSGPPTGDPDRVVGTAWQWAFGRRRTLRARAARHVGLPDVDVPDTRRPRTAVEQVVVELGQLTAAGRVTPTAARILAATAAGWPTAETARALGSTPTAVRACRARALRDLTATSDRAAA